MLSEIQMSPAFTLGRRHRRNEEAIVRSSTAPNARSCAFPATHLQHARTHGAGIGLGAGCKRNAAVAEVERVIAERPVLMVGWDSRWSVIEPP
jgi:hypothetical protein